MSFFHVCFNIKGLKLSQGFQIWMNQPEVTLTPRGKLKMPTFTQLIRTLSHDEEAHTVSKDTAYITEAFLRLNSKHMAF